MEFIDSILNIMDVYEQRNSTMLNEFVGDVVFPDSFYANDGNHILNRTLIN
ncbi:hypothetical protein GCM10023345_15950 [Acinetobacter kookii]